MDELIKMIVADTMDKIKYDTKFWSPFYKDKLRNELIKRIEKQLTPSPNPDSPTAKSGKNKKETK